MIMSHLSHKNNRRKNKNQVCRLAKRMSNASLTVECAAVLPIFFFACITLIMFMDAVRIQGEKNLDLSNKVRTLAEAAGLKEQAEGSDGRWIDIRKVQKYSYPFALPGIPALRMLLRARVYPWIGSSEAIGSSTSEGSDDEDGIVLITDNQSVYHTDPGCTHLDLTVFKSTTSEIRNLRNDYGRKYKKCRGFPRGYSGPVYASAKGDYYYPSDQYGSLVRHVHIVRKSECAGLEECERCSMKHSSRVHADDAA